MQLPLVQPSSADAPRARLPALQEQWVTALLGALPPAETRTTCDACVKVAPAGQPLGPKQFHPDTKCCTYLPVLHNFQVGALLDDARTSPEGLASLQRRIDDDVGVTPVGLIGNAEYFQRYTNEAFGRDPTLRCPHYLPSEGGRCGVWHHRNATCSTWFCCCDRGRQSFAFWRKGLMPALRLAEETVSEWALFALGASESDWGPWGDRRAFYRAAARIGYGLQWERVLVLGGSKLRTLSDQAAQLHQELVAAPPDAEWESSPTEI
jgi:hypothetical protein